MLIYLIQDRYTEFLNCTRTYAYVHTLKRAGAFYQAARADDDGAITYTDVPLDSIDLAVHCPACPHDQINLPSGWQDAPAKDK